MSVEPESLVRRIRALDVRAAKEKTAVADERAAVVAELAELVGVVPAAELLGVTRASIYKGINRAKKKG